MTIDSELEELAVRNSAESGGLTTEPPLSMRRRIIAFLVFLGLIVILQIASGAYRSEFNAYPDESSHYVTSVMLSDYFAHFHFQSPIEFAKSYYHHYPKVALGHWPPFFYMVQALWMLLFSASRTSVRLEMAFTTALLAYSVFLEGRRWFGWRLGFAGSLLTICLPLMQTYSDEEMAESLLTLTCFWSAVFFGKYVDSERWRDSLLFGLFFSLAVLTKGSGWLLAVVPPVTLVLTRKWRLLRQWSFWMPFVLIFVLCVPWQLMTMRLAEQGWDGGSRPSISYTVDALVEFVKLFPEILGPVLLILMLVGIAVSIGAPMLRGAVSIKASTMLALLLGVWIFHSIVPAGVENRKLVIAVPAMVLFALCGAAYMTGLMPRGSSLFRWRWVLVGGLAAISFFAITFHIPKQQRYGYIDAAQYLATRPDLKSATILVSSESGGEGMLVSEMAMNQPDPSNVVIRGTKSLAKMEWNATNYRSVYSTPSEVLHYLENRKVRLIVTDNFAPQVRFPHNELLKQTIQQDRRFRLLASFSNRDSTPAGEVRIYKFEM
jgi:hypothetical protein